MKPLVSGPPVRSRKAPGLCPRLLVLFALSAIASCDLGQDVPLGGVKAAAQGGAGGEVGEVWSFSDPAPLTLLNTEDNDDNPSLSFDLLTLCWTSLRAGGTGDADIWCSVRTEVESGFEAPTEAVELNSPVFETSSALSSDGLEIWFGSRREGGLGGIDIWTSTRAGRMQPWQEPSLEVALNSAFDDIPRPLGFTGQVMPMASRRVGGLYNTYFAERNLDSSEFSEPALVVGLNEQLGPVGDAFLLEDGLTLLFARETNTGTTDLFVTQRLTPSDPFQPASPLGGVNSEADERDPWLSPDGTQLYFSSNRSGNFDLFVASRTADK